MALPKANRLKNKKDFDLVFKKGTAVRGNFLFIKTRNNGSHSPRFSVIVPAKLVSGAVDRNRIKRLLTGIIQKKPGKEFKGRDIAVVLNKKSDQDSLGREFSELLAKINNGQNSDKIN